MDFLTVNITPYDLKLNHLTDRVEFKRVLNSVILEYPDTSASDKKEIMSKVLLPGEKKAILSVILDEKRSFNFTSRSKDGGFTVSFLSKIIYCLHEEYDIDLFSINELTVDKTNNEITAYATIKDRKCKTLPHC
jgi:hypothetical protein